MAVRGLKQLEDFIDRLKALETAMHAKTIDIVKSKEKELLDINRAQMEASGEKPDDSRILYKKPRKGRVTSGGYTEKYARWKKKHGPHKDVSKVNLKLTGEFHNSLTLDYQGNLEWNVVSKADVHKYLKKNYGKVLGFQDDRLAPFMKEVIKPEMIAFLKRYLKP